MAIKPFNSVGGFSVGESPANIILANGDITTSNANLSANLYVINTANVGNLRTDHLLYANGVPWDFQEAAGSNTYIQYNMGNDFAASANFTYDDSLQLLSVLGNANVTKTLIGNVANFSGNLTSLNANLGNLATANYVNVATQINGNVANFSGNLTSLNANLGNLAEANFVNVASNLITSNLTTNTNVNFTSAGNVSLGNVSNLHITGGSPDQILKTDGNGNLSWSSGTALANGYSNVTIPVANGNVIINANGGVDQQWTFGTDGNLTGPATGLADLGNLVIANYVNVAQQINGNVANFTGNLTALNANLGNLAVANYAQITSLANTQIPYANGTNVLVGSSSLIYDAPNPVLKVGAGGTEIGGDAGYAYIQTKTGNFSGNINSLNANLGNLATANFVNVSSNLNVTDTANVGNLRTNHLLYANGQPWDLQEAAGSNTQIQYNEGNGNFGASGNFTWDYVGNVLTVDGNANVTGTTETANAKVSTLANTQVVYANANSFLVGNSNFVFDDIASNLTVTGNIIATGSFVGNITGNITAPGANTQILFNDANIANAVANFAYDKAYNSGGGELNVGNTVGGQIITDNVYASYGNIGNLDVTTDIVAGGNITTSGAGGDITMTGGNITGVNNISANTANFTGNITAANITGALANGTSNVKVYNNANVEITIGGSANSATFASTGLYVVGEINTTAGNMLSNGNITANGFLNSANANVTGEAQLGSVLTSNITATTGTITISAAGSDQNIILAPSGVGNVDVGLHNITQVALPVNPNDAATKEYVDNTAQGLQIHTAANVTSRTNLTATYYNGGTVLSVTTIAGGKTITFSTNHGLVVNDDITFTNSFNGIVGGEAYFVFSVPALNQITIKDGYFGAEVTTLTNATGLTQAALGNGGVGATLTNAGAQIALTIDSVLMTVGARVLVQGQTNQFENGIYDVTTVGTGATNWVLTRSSDGDSYQPTSDSALCAGSYFFISQGSLSAGASYVLTSPSGEIIIGVDNIVFSQFGQAGSYTSGNGIAITGTVISANIDGVTTDIVGGNIVVKTGANLTTPNLGDATFSTLTWNNLSNGNVTANNLSIGNIANITANLTVGGLIQANGNISSNATVNGNNAYFTNFANVGGNLLANNITSNALITTVNANISSNLVASNATVNLAFSGNTANFSGNVIVPNLTVNLAISGNTANFTGNVTALNANLGNLATANYVNVSQQINGNTATFTGNVQLENIVNPTANTSIGMGNGSGIVAIYSAGNATHFAPSGLITLGGVSQIVGGTFGGSGITLGGSQTDIFQNRGGNVTVQVGTGGSISKTWTFAQDGSLTVPGNLDVTNIVSNVVTANTSVVVGDSTIEWGTVTTTSVTANQTIATYNVTGVTGLEFIVKGIDTLGSKYSMATVQAVTDGMDVDYATFSTVNLGGLTGSLTVNIVAGNVALQVTPASSNSTLWTTQVRFI